MRKLSFRVRALCATVPPAALVLLVLVVLVHARDRRQLERAMEGSLALKREEVEQVLAQGRSYSELVAFLELESSYSSPDSEFFYELHDASGRLLAGSPNLGDARIGPQEVQGYARCPHPLRPGEEVLILAGPLGNSAGSDARPETWATVALALEPHLRTARAELLGSVLVAAGGLLVLILALWFGVGSSLRSVSLITREAAAIRVAGLRRRLPCNGSGDELDRLTGELNGLFAGLEASLVQMEAFTSDAAHQLRTPLTRIRGELDLVLAGPARLDPEVRDSLERTRGELERLSGTCGKLLLLARLDRGAQASELCAAEFALDALAEELVDEMRPVADEAGIELEFAARGSGRVRGSRELCGEALLNLLENALRHTPRGGRIRVGVERADEAVRLDVEDSGPGVPADERELVFQRFHRGRKALPGGTGLGLSIVRGIARAHGGDAELVPSARGAAFRVSLPAA